MAYSMIELAVSIVILGGYMTFIAWWSISSILRDRNAK